jgi:hypothetical protein
MAAEARMPVLIKHAPLLSALMPPSPTFAASRGIAFSWIFRPGGNIEILPKSHMLDPVIWSERGHPLSKLLIALTIAVFAPAFGQVPRWYDRRP